MNVNLCQYKSFSCFGCCGHTWGDEEEVLEQIRKNTIIFKNISLKEFQERSERALSRSGGCKSLVFKNRKIVCSLHPKQVGEDFRDKNCNKNHLCDTILEFQNWPLEKQKAFLKFIEKKNPSHYDYSMSMDTGRFLKEFKKQYKTTKQ